MVILTYLNIGNYLAEIKKDKDQNNPTWDALLRIQKKPARGGLLRVSAASSSAGVCKHLKRVEPACQS
jgi:hypothetical protein